MRDLLPFTQYSFCVRAVTDGDEGPLSEPVTITTEEDGKKQKTVCPGNATASHTHGKKILG